MRAEKNIFFLAGFQSCPRKRGVCGGYRLLVESPNPIIAENAGGVWDDKVLIGFDSVVELSHT